MSKIEEAPPSYNEVNEISSSPSPSAPALPHPRSNVPPSIEMTRAGADELARPMGDLTVVKDCMLHL